MSAVFWSALCLLLCAAATSTNTGITLLPRNLTVREGEDATFTCEVPCSHEAFWYVGDLFNSFALPFTDTVPGISYSRILPEDLCDTSDPGTYTDSLTITGTTLELNNVAVQCSASMIDCTAGDASCGAIMYSRFRVLRVESAEPSPPPPPSPSSPEPSSSSSCSTVVEQSTACPTPSPVVVTSIATSVSTTTRTHTETQTKTFTSTTTLIPTPTDCPPSVDRSDALASPTLLKGLGLTSAVAVSALLVIMSVLLHL